MGVITQYAHVVESTAATGDVISAGQVIGCVGSTGWSTGMSISSTKCILSDENIWPKK